LLEIEERQDLISKVIEGMHIQNWDCPSKNWNDARMKQALIFLTVIQKSENCCQLVRKSVDVRRLIEGLVCTLKEIIGTLAVKSEAKLFRGRL
jgi:hypothetical protein